MSKGNNRSAEELRRRAEKRLQNKQKASPSKIPAESQRLIHELEVHQIELEMQNEQLQQARSGLEAYLSQYTDLYDFAPVGYFTLRSDGTILKANLTGANLLGVERARLLHQNLGRFVTADSCHLFTTFLPMIFQSQSQQAFDLELQKDGGKFFVHLEARVLESGLECRVVMMDITPQKRAEESLRKSEQKFRTLFETMSQGVLLQGADGKIILANPAAERILDLPLALMQERSLTDRHWRAIQEDGSDFPKENDPSIVALRTGKLVQNVVMGVFSVKAESYSWLTINAVPQFMPGEDRPYQVFITLEDITFSKRMVIYNHLTPREKEVFKLLAKGLNRRIIAEMMHISSKTVDKHRENLMVKLNLYTIEGIMQFAKLIGLAD